MDELQEKVEAMYSDDIDKVEKGENRIKQLMKKKTDNFLQDEDFLVAIATSYLEAYLNHPIRMK